LGWLSFVGEKLLKTILNYLVFTEALEMGIGEGEGEGERYTSLFIRCIFCEKPFDNRFSAG
jgi:hypothetical protein